MIAISINFVKKRKTRLKLAESQIFNGCALYVDAECILNLKVVNNKRYYHYFEI